MPRPKPSVLLPERFPPKKIPRTPEQLAQGRRRQAPKLIGTNRVEVALRFTLSRETMERDPGGAVDRERGGGAARALTDHPPLFVRTRSASQKPPRADAPRRHRSSQLHTIDGSPTLADHAPSPPRRLSRP